MSTSATANRVAIFGATSGIAVAVGRHYAERGAALVLVGRDATALAAVASDFKVRGSSRVETVIADFSNMEGLATVAAAAWEALGGLDLALVAYGSLPDQVQSETDCANAGRALMLNFISPALLAGELANRFEQSRAGTLAVITSVAGDRGRRSNYIYGAAKGGLQRFLEGLRHRLFASGVTVIDIRPGFVSTRMTAHLPQSGSLWVAPTRVAADIVAGVERRCTVLYTPWFWRPIMAIVRTLPELLMHRTRL